MRSRQIVVVSLVLPTVAAGALACSSPPEEPILQQFFRSSRLRATTALASFSTAVFEPGNEGTVSRFEIVSVSAERRVPLTLSALAQAHVAAQAEDEEFTKRKLAYQQENMDAIKRVLKAEGASVPLKGQDAEVQAAWTKYRQETTQITRKVADARRRMIAESAVVELSLDDPRTKVDDITKREGEMVSKEVTLDAPVRQPGGESSQKTLIVTMQRAVLKGDPPAEGKWIITSVREPSASPATPSS
jgi:hypothetical protein